MAPEIAMPLPVCLIENQEGKDLVINKDAAQILSDITQPVVVVAIVGKYRTGKSYLMNKLAGKRNGFALGSTVQSKTKGIWMWCVPHPSKPGHTLVLLDTEGLGDVEKGDSRNDAWIFSLAVLLSSTLVYNSVGTIDQDSVEKLHYVTELTERIKVKSSPKDKDEDEDDSAEFKRIFPSFIWCVRDFTLELELDGKRITEDEYLQNALKLKRGLGKNVMDYNLPRECVHHFFHSHKCFVFETPARSADLHRVEELPESQLCEGFVRQAERFCDYVYVNGQPKTHAGGHPVTGRMLGNLTVMYVDSIRSGSVPCIENAVLALAQIENTAAIHEALSKYEDLMGQVAKSFPTESQEQFLNLQKECEKEAVRVFMDRSFKDEKREYQAQLMRDLLQKFGEFSRYNEEASARKCGALIQELSATLERRLTHGDFCKPGGHKHLLEEKQKLVDAYNRTPGKGIKALEVLQGFLMEKKKMEAAILQADQSLSKREKQVEESRIQREAAQQKMEIEEEKNICLEQTRKEQMRGFEQQMLMLKEKLEQDRLKMLKENERLMEERMKEKQDLLRDGLTNKAAMREQQIQELKKQNDETSSNSWITKGICLLADVASLVLPGVYGKAAVFASNLLKRIF